MSWIVQVMAKDLDWTDWCMTKMGSTADCIIEAQILYDFAHHYEYKYRKVQK